MSWRGDLSPACWDASDVSAMIPVEAEARSDAVFVATHSELPILRRRQVDSAEGEVVSERALLEAVAAQPPDYPILPILGRSGAGKSHFVRWLRTNLEIDEKTRVVFIPKHRTSLRGILRRILEFGEGDVFSELRQRVDQAVDALGDETEARLRLRDELGTRVQIHGVEAAEYEVSAEEKELREYLAENLRHLLQDALFEQAYLADDSAIARLVSEKLHGRGDEDKEEAFGFSPNDVRIAIDDTARAGHAANEIAASLASDPELPKLAARMLNEQLDPAVRAVFGLGGDDLKDLLVELRLELAGRGESLLLLVEDFSIFQGIQGGLVDAMTLIPTEEVPVCAMQVVMALTTGYFTNQMPDTVKTRTYRVFDLDVPAEQRTEFDPARFVSKYLNATRVGEEPLKAAFEDGEAFPNACDTCPVTPECHDAFGEVDGIGLFPFNRPALSKTIASQMGSDDEFVARDVLNRVIRPVLHREHEAIANEQFPSEAFEEEFSSGAEGVLDIEDEEVLKRSEDAPDLHRRRVRLVRFWSRTEGAQNLHPTIHEAFAIPPVDDLEVQRPPRKRPEDLPKDDTEAEGGPKRRSRDDGPPAIVSAVDRWIETGELRQAERRELRRIIQNIVVQRLDLEDGHWNAAQWTGSDWYPSFKSEGVLLGDERAPTTEGLVTLRIEGGRSEDARALRALAWFSEAGDWRAIRNGASLQRIAMKKVSDWASRVEEGLLPPRDGKASPELVAVVHALRLGAQMLGIPESYRGSLDDSLASLVATPNDVEEARWPGSDLLREAALTGRVSNAATREQLQQRLFRLASFAQGVRGKPQALDVPRIAQALSQEVPAKGEHDTLPSEVARHLAVLDAVLDGLDQQAEEVRDWLPDPDEVGSDDLKHAKAVLDGVVDHARRANVVTGSVEFSDIRTASRELEPADGQRVRRFRERLDEWSTLDQSRKLRALTDDWYPAASRLKQWIEAADATLKQLERGLRSGTSDEPEVEVVRERLLGAVGRSEGALKRLLEQDGDEEVIA